MARGKSIFGQRGERAVWEHTDVPLFLTLFVLRFLERERCGGPLTSGRLGACCLPDGLQPVRGAQGAAPTAMAGNTRDTSQLRFFFQVHVTWIASSFPRALFGCFPVKLLMEARSLTVHRTTIIQLFTTQYSGKQLVKY